jgi:DNA-directed RNA polymerase subunit K/omega
MNVKEQTGKEEGDLIVKKEEILERAHSAYEAVVAIAKEARRLNAAPGVYLNQGEKPIPKAVRNFVDGRVEYEVEGNATTERKPPKKGKRKK